MVSRGPFQFGDVEKDKLLLVEGVSDARFFNAFLRDGLNQTNVQIAQVGGNQRFRPFLSQILKNAGNFRELLRLGIISDADTNPAAAFQRISDALACAGLPVPPQSWRTAGDGGLSVSIAILPDGSGTGDLEELCLRSLSNGPAMACIDQYVTCMANVGVPVRQPSKSRLHAYLAVAGSEPGRRVGEAADAGIWDWNSPTFEQVAEFRRNLAVS